MIFLFDHSPIGGQITQTHRTAHIRALGRGGNFGAQPQLAAICETSANVIYIELIC
jgi:hypothetical protein